MGILGKSVSGLIALALLAIGGVLAFGTGTPATELASISAPFRSVDFSTLPPIRKQEAGIGGPVAYRQYGPADTKQAIILLHGSTASSSSMHPLAQFLAAQGMAVYVPDVRGHGETGRRGDIEHESQLSDDIETVISIARTAHPDAVLTLVGFSAGGGLAIRYAGSPGGHLIDRYVFVAPALGRGAPTTRNEGDLWATPHVPRIVAISLLNRVGIHWFDGLEAIRFAVPPDSGKILTPSYSYRLLNAMLPVDYAADLKKSVRPMFAVMAEKDELFDQPTLRRTLMDVRPDISVSIVPGSSHIGLILEPAGMEAIARTIRGEGIEERPDELDSDGVRAPPLGEAPATQPPQQGG